VSAERLPKFLNGEALNEAFEKQNDAELNFAGLILSFSISSN